MMRGDARCGAARRPLLLLLGTAAACGALGAGALAGCGASDSNVTVMTSSSKGSVGGVVLDAAPGLPPLPGVEVMVIAGGTTFSMIQTDMQGAFSVKEVPSGTVIVKLAKADHDDVYLTGTLSSSAGNFPVNNATLTLGPIAMMGTKGSFVARLVDESGAPQAGVKVTARMNGSYLDLTGGNVVPRGVVDVAAASAADGLVTLGGLPDFAGIGALVNPVLTINVPPVKLAGGTAGSYQFLGFTGDFYPIELGRNPRGEQLTTTIVLAGPHTPLQVLSSNDDWFVTGGTGGPTGPIVPTSGPVTVTFNQAVAPSALKATLYTERGGIASVMVTPTVTANLVRLDVAPALAPSTRYNLALHAVSAYPQQAKEYNLTAPLFTPSDKVAPVTVNASLSHIEGNDYVIVFSEPIGVGYRSASAVPCVVFYEADLDGSSQVTSPGEWSSGGNAALKCNPGGSPLGHFLRPDEPTANGMPVTGFSSQWRLAVRQACLGQYLCNPSGAIVHLQFSRNSDPSLIVKRVDGTPVPDLAITLPQF